MLLNPGCDPKVGHDPRIDPKVGRKPKVLFNKEHHGSWTKNEKSETDFK